MTEQQPEGQNEYPEIFPDLATLTEPDARTLFLALSERAFSLASTDEARGNVLGGLLLLVEEDRVLEHQREANRRLAVLQVHQIETGQVPLASEMDEAFYPEGAEDESDDDSDATPVTIIHFIPAAADDSDDSDDGECEE